MSDATALPDDGLPVVTFASADELELWLEAHHETGDGAWLRMAKKSTGIPSIDWDGAVDVLLCFGWIDGIRRRIDDQWFAQRVTPRRPRSVWSKINCARVERLEAEGRMRDAGRVQVERAKGDGRWDAAYSVSKDAALPAELQVALDAHPVAAQRFSELNSTNRTAIVFRVGTPKRPDTRERKAREFVEMLERGDVPYPKR